MNVKHSRVSYMQVFYKKIKKVFLKISQNLEENTCAEVFFLKKLQTSMPVTLLKSDFSTVVLL